MRTCGRTTWTKRGILTCRTTTTTTGKSTTIMIAQFIQNGNWSSILTLRRSAHLNLTETVSLVLRSHFAAWLRTAGLNWTGNGLTVCGSSWRQTLGISSSPRIKKSWRKICQQPFSTGMNSTRAEASGKKSRQTLNRKRRKTWMTGRTMRT